MQRYFPALAVLALLAIATPFSTAATDKPNIIVILADDMGYADAGFTGCKDIKTPNLDQLAASGVVFTQGYSNHSYCGPARAALLTGRYQHRFGFENNPAYDTSNPNMGLDPKETLFPERLQKAGYTTGMIGKWHLGAATVFQPNKRGFDYFYGFLGGGHDYFKIDLTRPVNEGYLQGLQRNTQPAGFEGYLTTALSRDAVDFVDQNKDKPFFLYLAYNAPHGPLQAPKEDIARYAHIENPNRRTYAAMVDVMDRGIGEVMTALEKNGIRDNTLVFFMSDNGGPQATKEKPSKWNGSSNAPFRAGKGSFHEGGIHVPFIASWPAKIAAGSKFEKPVIAIDVARTAVEQAGGKAETGKGMEGVDLIPFVTGEKNNAPHEALFWKKQSRYAVLFEDGHKQVREGGKGSAKTFFLPNDITESKNLQTEKPEVATALKKSWDKWNEANKPDAFHHAPAYHKLRDAFFEESVPDHSESPSGG